MSLHLNKNSQNFVKSDIETEANFKIDNTEANAPQSTLDLLKNNKLFNYGN